MTVFFTFSNNSIPRAGKRPSKNNAIRNGSFQEKSGVACRPQSCPSGSTSFGSTSKQNGMKEKRSKTENRKENQQSAIFKTVEFPVEQTVKVRCKRKNAWSQTEQPSGDRGIVLPFIISSSRGRENTAVSRHEKIRFSIISPEYGNRQGDPLAKTIPKPEKTGKNGRPILP